MDGKRIILAAHRGDKARHPENTMPAFKAALELGMDMIETDIHMTKDGELVLIHDGSTLRTTGVDAQISELTLAEAKKLNAGATFPTGEAAEIPTVREFLELIKDTKMLVNWEFKVYPSENEAAAFEAADKLIALLEEYGMTERSMMNSFSIRVLEYIYKKHGRRFPIHGQGIAQCARSKDACDTPPEELFDWCCIYPTVKGASVLDFKENFDYCTERGILPCLCIPDDAAASKKAIDYGCRMFTSNDIVKADDILRALGVR